MARKFLYFVAFCIIAAIAGLFALNLFQDDLTRMAFVPDEEFVEQAALEPNAYEGFDLWYARPGKAGDDITRYQPQFEETGEGEGDPASSAQGRAAMGEEPDAGPASDELAAPRFAVFFVHPTSFIDRDKWNAPLGDEATESRSRLIIKAMASPFNRAAEIWAPKYRQATAGAFLTDEPEAQMALDSAYRDVEQAFDIFLEQADPSLPIVLAGHSQGGWHILQLLREKVAGTPVESRIAMVYPIGWPVSVTYDLPALPLPACDRPDQPACILTWSSFAEPADAGMIMKRYSATPGFTGEPRGDSPILCVNPITGIRGSAASAEENLGTLVPNESLTDGALVRAAVPARCDEDGLLLIGDPPDLGPGVLPGNNYHVYDIMLFWRNLQVDVERRLRAREGSAGTAAGA
ncbi:DUF3089 domain-containing protein [Paraurantiacibacter namhicola]|uniref:DUF3089 domain-containing protein n=1 Tax=Paraurantiacibacter namhicola TaxID=645517 RepID=A0A1C7D7F4_9SPHN|nr:DUF3089 domain-containing protein [Paraurantiacibacter namhicola]ANU07404.1 hypothetical protein A6F65_01096 [Paraurantiacibacter namhicola]